MAANFFLRLGRFHDEESLVMAAHWSIPQIDNHESLTHSVTQFVTHVGMPHSQMFQKVEYGLPPKIDAL